MKRATLMVLAFLLCLPAGAQIFGKRKAKETESEGKDRPPRVLKVTGTPMFYEVIDGDTVFVDSIDPVWIFPKGSKISGTDWRKNYKLVYNFNKVYPYALVGRRLMRQVDSTIRVDVSKKGQKNAYTHDVMMELFGLFEKDIRNMTVSQGMLLMRLVDRECGMPPYSIIKTYRSGFTAGFWQMVAKLFGADLKKRYEPTGMDKKTEQLVGMWDSGMWESFYYSVFYDYPKRTVVPSSALRSTVKSREDRRHREEAEAKEKEVMKRALESAMED